MVSVPALNNALADVVVVVDVVALNNVDNNVAALNNVVNNVVALADVVALNNVVNNVAALVVVDVVALKY
jgi:hypothetical protein